MANKNELQTFRDKSIDELEVLAEELSSKINDERVKSYFSDQTSVNDVKSNKIMRARILTILTEKKNVVQISQEDTKESI